MKWKKPTNLKTKHFERRKVRMAASSTSACFSLPTSRPRTDANESTSLIPSLPMTQVTWRWRHWAEFGAKVTREAGSEEGKRNPCTFYVGNHSFKCAKTIAIIRRFDNRSSARDITRKNTYSLVSGKQRVIQLSPDAMYRLKPSVWITASKQAGFGERKFRNERWKRSRVAWRNFALVSEKKEGERGRGEKRRGS